MYAVDVCRTVDRPPQPVFDYLLDFQRYGEYPRSVAAVSRVTGGEGVDPTQTRYEVRAGWRGIQGTVTTVVTDVDPPERIAWRLADTTAVNGAWTVADAPPAASADPGCRIELSIRFDAAALDGVVDTLPRILPMDVIVRRLASAVETEAEAVLDRIVADLEDEPGEPRDPGPSTA